MNIIKKQILNKQLAVEKNIETYKATTEKTIFENALSTCATILSKLNYNNLTKEEIEILLREFKPTDNK